MKSQHFEKIPRENRPEASCFTQRRYDPSYDVICKEAGNGVKSVMLRLFYQKIYETALLKG